MTKNKNTKNKNLETAYKKKLKYIKPEVLSYTNDDIIKHLGPAQACSISPCSVTP